MFASLHRPAAAALVLLLAGCAAKPVAPVRVPSPVPPPRAAEPLGFGGLTGAALTARFGAPVFSRKDGPTDLWRYDSGACRVFFFLNGDRVSHVETLPRGPNNVADQSCLSALKKP